MVHDDGIINQSKPVMLNNEEKLDRISHTLVFYVNGKEVIDDNVNPEWTLLWYLRNK